MVGSINRNHLPGASEWSKALAYFAAFRRLFVPQLNLADMMTSWVVCDESHRDIHWMYPQKKSFLAPLKLLFSQSVLPTVKHQPSKSEFRFRMV